MAKSIIRGDMPIAIDSAQFVGDRYEGECLRELRIGRLSPVTVSVYKRRDDSHFLRVTVASQVKPKHYMRANVDLDSYISETDFLKSVLVHAGAAAEKLVEQYGDTLDPDEIAKEATSAARRCLREINE